MRLHTEIISERGKAVNKTGNDYIKIDLTVDKKPIGSIELELLHDRLNGYDQDEWLLKYYPDEESDPEIITQGNI